MLQNIVKKTELKLDNWKMKF